MGLKSSIAGATFPNQVLAYSMASNLRQKCTDFFSGAQAPASSAAAFLRPPPTSVWVGQTRIHWLPYFGGKVTALPLRDAPILTGLMSGCPLAIFTYNGQPYLGHIGTVDDEEDRAAEKNAAVKQSWQAAVDSGQISPTLAWNPAADTPDTGYVGAPQIFGMATAHSKAYSLRCTIANNVFTVADVRNGTTAAGQQCVRAVLAISSAARAARRAAK